MAHIKKFEELNENVNDFDDRKEEAKLRKHLYEREDSDVVHWDDLELDMKRDFGEFTNIKVDDAKWVMDWLKNKIVDKKIEK